MIIGLDFDNTIVCYDQVFHAVAVEQNLIDANTPVNKIAVRDALRAKGQEDVWTEMQGYVYGKRMDLAQAYEGALDFIRFAKSKGIRCIIISHKTRIPYKGPAYDLHAAAREWIDTHLIDIDGPLIPESDVYFHETKTQKIERIENLSCDLFIDDLPEILNADNFPKKTKSFLFDPENNHASLQGLDRVKSWKEFWDLVGVLR